MPNSVKSNDWMDFGAKIVYICEKIFNGDIDKLIYYFTDQSTPSIKKSRKKTIENWLEGRTKKPNGFHLSLFKISEYELNGEQLLTHNAFQKWSIEQFQKRIDIYLAEKENQDIPNEMRFIYFFNAIEYKLSYFEITYPQPENDLVIQLSSPLYTSNMNYHGSISNYNNMTYISVKNQFDCMHYIFKNNVNVYRHDLKVFGVAQCVDAPTREPKSYLALLTSKKLTQEEENKFAHKLNFSNRMIADDFTHSCVLEKDYFLENFSEKIEELSRDIDHYSIKESLSKDMYFDIVLEEYKIYIKLLKQSIFHNDYSIDHKRQSILFALEDMCQDSKAEATIAYLLDPESINILDNKNSIMEMQLKLVQSNKLKLSYLFMVQDLTLLTDRVIEQIEYIEKNGISVKLTNCTKSIYSKILLVKHKNFSIYKRKHELGENNVTRNATTIEALTYDVEYLSKQSVTLNAFTQEHYPLNGIWYSYSYGSKMDGNSCHVVKFEIKNSSVKATFPQKVNYGDIYKSSEFILLLLEHSVIKIHNINIGDKIFRVSIIGKEQNMHNRDVLLFGLMSRDKLPQDDALMLLGSIHEKGDEEFRLKISNEFDSKLAYFEMD